MELEKQIFEGKTISNLLQEVYEKHKENDDSVKSEISRLSSFINSAGDAIVIVPLLKELLDSGLKNDEVLMKMVQLFKQPVEKKSQEDDNGLLSEKDIQQLFNDVAVYKAPNKQIENN
jgi:hypothetical protein